jgi:imidazolonepropionase-like amidohydrolase
MTRAASLVALLLSTLVHAGIAAAQTVAITNGRIHTVSGPVLERGTVVIQDGRIAAVGADVAIPAGAQVVDASGKTVTPGLLDSSTAIGTIEIDLAAGTNDASSTNDRITASFDAADNLNPFSTLIPVTRVEGVTRVVVAPLPGRSFVAGRGLLIQLGHLGAEVTIDRNPIGLYVTLGERGAALSGGARATTLVRLREILQDARDFDANRAAYEARDRRDYGMSRLDLEALVPVVRGELPLIITVNRAADILNVLRLAREGNVRVILQQAAEGWMVARAIAEAGVPVIVNPLTNLPTFDAAGISFENAARLHAAGVTVVFASFESHNSRNLKQIAGNAVSHGMPFDAALRAVTLAPAQLWGIGDRYGRIEAGVEADVVVWSGDPFEVTTNVEHVFIRGVRMPMDTRQGDLLRRYRQIEGDGPPGLPPAYRK